MNDRPKVAWAEVRGDYEAANSSKYTIARRHGTTVAEIDARAEANKWSDAKRTESTDRIILISRLLGVLELQIEHLEKAEMTTNGEKEAAVLGKLTENLGKLINMANAEARGTATETETAEMREIRNKLAERINALTKK